MTLSSDTGIEPLQYETAGKKFNILRYVSNMIGPIWVSEGSDIDSVISDDIGTYRASMSSAPQAGHGFISPWNIAR